jgi:hypothetical protein
MLLSAVVPASLAAIRAVWLLYDIGVLAPVTDWAIVFHF